MTVADARQRTATKLSQIPLVHARKRRINIEIKIRIYKDKAKHKDNCKDRLVWTEHDVNDVVHVSEDPLLLKFLRNFVPIGQISAAMFVLRTIRILREIL